jgi:hypothetical protein
MIRHLAAARSAGAGIASSATRYVWSIKNAAIEAGGAANDSADGPSQDGFPETIRVTVA